MSFGVGVPRMKELFWVKMKVTSNYLPAFARFFNRAIIQEFIQDKPITIHNTIESSGAFTSKENGSMNYAELFDKIYSILKKTISL